MPIGFESRQDCPLCGSDRSNSLTEIPYRDPILAEFITRFYQGRVPLVLFSDEKYCLVQCVRCDFIFHSQVLNVEGMTALYSDWVDQQASLEKKQQARSKLYRQYSNQIEALGRLLPQPPARVKILEYGMGWGFWSRMARAHGYDVTGFELSEQRCRFAATQGIDTIAELPEEKAVFDCVYANQVFEHLNDPLDDLNRLVACLKPGGLVYIRVPDGRGVAWEINRHGWSGRLDAVHPFEHINCFTRKTLIDLGQRAGLKPVNFPLRLNLPRLWGSIKREIADRYLTTHLLFRK